MSDVIIQRFGSQGSIREFPKGRFDVLELHGVSVGRASYEPGWKWSTHVGAASGEALCQVEHVGLVVSGRIAVSYPDGKNYELSASDVFYIPPGHDSWVLGDEPYVSIHFAGAESYAR